MGGSPSSECSPGQVNLLRLQVAKLGGWTIPVLPQEWPSVRTRWDVGVMVRKGVKCRAPDDSTCGVSPELVVVVSRMSFLPKLTRRQLPTLVGEQTSAPNGLASLAGLAGFLLMLRNVQEPLGEVTTALVPIMAGTDAEGRSSPTPRG
jgi:hypothetical protein